MKEQAFHHALKIDNELCFGCTHCMTACPTGAIRVRDGKAKIYENRCIDCGVCLTACPAKAISVEQDDFQMIFNYKRRVALVPCVLLGQFDTDIDIRQITAALYELGFTDVYEVENGVDFLVDNIRDYMTENGDTKPLISSYCPAIVRLIQVKFPSLVQHLIKRKQPLDIAAIYYRKKLEDAGVEPNDIGIFYITPCAAKIAAIKSPVGEEHSSIDGVINMNFIFNKISWILKNNKNLDFSDIEASKIHHRSIRWPLTNGEIDRFEGRCLAIDEVHNAIEFLEKLENDEVTDIDFVEIRACDESCAGGILTVINRFIAVEGIKKRSKRQRESLMINPVENPILDEKEYLHNKCIIHDIQPRSMMAIDEDINKAISKLEKVRRLMCYLPGTDCGMCGAPSCQSLAEDIAQRKAQMSYCVFVRTQMQNRGALSQERSVQLMRKIWGKNCFERDCTKRGAKNANK